MLTALSVARDCQMIDKHDKMMLVTVIPPANNSAPMIEWTLSENANFNKVRLSVFLETFLLIYNLSNINVDDKLMSRRLDVLIRKAMSSLMWNMARMYALQSLASRGHSFESTFLT